jgi:alkanesulfonate monooxygenase SsuD/methylene tetrahydromethanopterin reductase-like flavin-dependent oxidoreductase (luciferase family)
MQYGVFDHLDRNDLSLRDYYESRLMIIEAYDRLGFYAYHVAEHHSTPLGLAPSPSVFLSAVAQRTRRLRFGPLVYALPLYHPLRMIEDICMLDQMSGGRLEIGFGRGSVPAELIYYGQSPEQAQAIYTEALELILKGLTERTLTFHGQFFRFDNVPMELEPLQKPHPPIWYGVHAPETPSGRRARTCAL